MAENKKEIIYAKGINFFNPHEKAPEYVTGDISIKVDKDTFAFLEAHKDAKGYCKLTVMQGKEKPYVKLNTFVPKKEGATIAELAHAAKISAQNAEPSVEYPTEELDPNDIPF